MYPFFGIVWLDFILHSNNNSIFFLPWNPENNHRLRIWKILAIGIVCSDTPPPLRARSIIILLELYIMQISRPLSETTSC